MWGIWAKNANSDLLLPPDWERARGSCYCCSASTGEEQEPCQNCCAMALLEAEGHHPSAQATKPQPPEPSSTILQGAGRDGTSPQKKKKTFLQASPQGGKGTGTKPWTHWADAVPAAWKAKVSMRAIHCPRARAIPEGLAQQPLQQRRTQFFIQTLSHTFTSYQEPLTFCRAVLSSATPHPSRMEPSQASS